MVLGQRFIYVEIWQGKWFQKKWFLKEVWSFIRGPAVVLISNSRIIWWNTGQNVTLHSLYSVHWKQMSPYTHYTGYTGGKFHLTLIRCTLEKISPYTHDTMEVGTLDNESSYKNNRVEHWAKCHLTLNWGVGGWDTEENVTLHLLRLWWDWNTGENVALQLLFSGTLDKRSPYTHYTVEHWTKGHLTLTIQWNTGQKVTLHSL